MRTAEALAARAMAEVISEGMSMSDFKIEKLVEDRAVCALDEIRFAACTNDGAEKKMDRIEKILDRYLAGSK